MYIYIYMYTLYIHSAKLGGRNLRADILAGHSASTFAIYNMYNAKKMLLTSQSLAFSHQNPVIIPCCCQAPLLETTF